MILVTIPPFRGAQVTAAGVQCATQRAGITADEINNIPIKNINRIIK
jgi:hypothetical protein